VRHSSRNTEDRAFQHFVWVRSPMTNIVGDTSGQIGPLPVAERPLAGRTALVVGVANKYSIAFGIAHALRGFGADVAMTYLKDKTRSYTQELATALEVRPERFLKCDVRVEGQMSP
jgi:enoyl-[acyl-carrier protein] reductase I